MHIVIFILRTFGAFICAICAIACLGSKDWYAGAGYLLSTIVTGWPLLPVLLSRIKIRTDRPDLSGMRPLVIARHFAGGMCSLLGPISLSDTYKDKDPQTAISLILLSLVISAPLDRIFFAPPSIGKQNNNWIYFIRNAGAYIFAAGTNFGEVKMERSLSLTLLIIGGLLLLVFPLYCLFTGKKLSLAAPQPAPRPSPPPHKYPTRPTPLAVSIATPLRPSLNSSIPIPKRASYDDASIYNLKFFLKAPTEARFYQMIRDFEESWLLVNNIRQRLAAHEEPQQFKEQTITELKAYCDKIKTRSGAIFKDKTRGYEKRSIIDLAREIWMGNTQIRSLYDATLKCCAPPYEKNILSLISQQVAEYRAMNNLIKRLDHWGKVYSTSPAAAAKAAEKAAKAAAAEAALKAAEAKATAVEKATAISSIIASLKASATLVAVTSRAVAASTPTAVRSAPSISMEELTHLNDQTYFTILDYIVLLGKNMEKYKDANEYRAKNDTGIISCLFSTPYRPTILLKGEAFNRSGKTDILIADNKGNNIFIAECKLWKGKAYLLDGLEQLLNNYVNWRDEKTALVVFNQQVREFSGVISTATRALSSHPLCHQMLYQRTDASWSYIFRHPNDPEKKIRLELVLFNFA